MAKYGNRMTKTTMSTTVGVGSLECPGSGFRRIKLTGAIFGFTSATLGTGNTQWEVNRSTAAATGTALTPSKLDTADSAAVSLIKTNLSVQGTNTTDDVPLAVPLNQQATFRWVANPGEEIVVPALANNGLHFNAPVNANNLTNGFVSIIFEEQ